MLNYSKTKLMDFRWWKNDQSKIKYITSEELTIREKITYHYYQISRLNKDQTISLINSLKNHLTKIWFLLNNDVQAFKLYEGLTWKQNDYM